MPGQRWSERDDVALRIFSAWLPSQLDGKDLKNLSDSVARANMEQAFRLADLFLVVRTAPHSG